MRLPLAPARLALGLVVAAGVLTLAACSASASPSTTASSAPATTASATPDAAASSGACTFTPAAGAVRTVSPPPAAPTLTGDVRAVIATSAGDIPLTLTASRTPCTVDSFASLAAQHYFSDTKCHRLTTAASGISVLQCGDPSGTGSGGPGYRFADELDGSETYPAGTVAMANAGAGTNGSQFFLVYGDSPLPPNYTVFGHLDAAGLAIVKKIASTGVAGGGVDGTPATPVTITGITVG